MTSGQSRYTTVPTKPSDGDDLPVDDGPPKWFERLCSSIPVVIFLSFFLVAVVLAVTFSLSSIKSGVFIENSVYSATCIDHMCLFGFSEYPRDIPCSNDRHCTTYHNPCASNPCTSTGTNRCVPAPKGGYACICKEGYGGPQCTTKVHPCDYQNPCFGQGTCVKHPTDEERFSCSCLIGWMGTRCQYRSQLGDTCARDDHCGNRGKCLQRNNLHTCHCLIGYHGLHCFKTIDVNDCSKQPCKEHGQCIDKEDGYDCICEFGRIGKRCGRRVDFGNCDSHCENGGSCHDDPTGLPFCKCHEGYGGTFCRVRDVSRHRRYSGGLTCQSHSKDRLQLQTLEGRWFLIALKNNTYNPPDACVQLSFVKTSGNLKNVISRNDSLSIRYMATRNDTSSHYKVEKITIDDTQTIVYSALEDTSNGTARLMIVGYLARLYAYPLTKIATYDDTPIEFGVIYSRDNYLVLHSCVKDDTHGHFDSLLVLSKNNDGSLQFGVVLQQIYRELPYVTGRMVKVERHCND